MNAARSPDGRSLYFTQGDSLYQIDVAEGERLEFGPPKLLFDGKPNQLAVSDGYDALPDGSGFVSIQRLPLKDAAIVYVQNWSADPLEARRALLAYGEYYNYDQPHWALELKTPAEV
jgi:hypothetical protein